MKLLIFLVISGDFVLKIKKIKFDNLILILTICFFGIYSYKAYFHKWIFSDPVRFQKMGGSEILIKKNLKRVNLENNYFKRCYIYSSTFYKSEARSLSIEECSIRSSVFKKMNLKFFQLRNIEILFSVFLNSNMEKARVEEAEISNSTFKNVNMKEATFKNTSVIFTLFENVDFRDADLSSVKLTGSTFKNVLINKKTKLPFSFKVAKKYGFIMEE